MRVCYFGTYRANYSRNQIMMEGLRRSGAEVVECHAPLWHSIEDRVQIASGGWLKPSFVMRVTRAYWRLLRLHRRAGDYDVMVLGYPGQLDAFLARLLTWLRRKPLAMDIFMSLYLIATERGLTAAHRFTGRLLYRIEYQALRLPDLLIQDTAEYVRWFQNVYDLNPARFRLVPTGADDRVFRPLEVVRRDDKLFHVLYYGTFIPNHGVETIVEAARLLAGEADIRFELIGQGPDRERAMELTRHYGLDNVTFVDWLDAEELVERAAAVDICLGVFGTTSQSLMTVQNKIYEGLAMAKPVITGDSTTVRQSLLHGKHVFLCERANPQSLADAILALQVNPGLRRRLAEHGHRLYRSQFDLQHNGATYAAHLRALVDCPARSDQSRRAGRADPRQGLTR